MFHRINLSRGFRQAVLWEEAAKWAVLAWAMQDGKKTPWLGVMPLISISVFLSTFIASADL